MLSRCEKPGALATTPFGGHSVQCRIGIPPRHCAPKTEQALPPSPQSRPYDGMSGASKWGALLHSLRRVPPSMSGTDAVGPMTQRPVLTVRIAYFQMYRELVIEKAACSKSLAPVEPATAQLQRGYRRSYPGAPYSPMPLALGETIPYLDIKSHFLSSAEEFSTCGGVRMGGPRRIVRTRSSRCHHVHMISRNPNHS